MAASACVSAVEPRDLLRAPFGLDDGSKFGGKPSLNIEMPEAQLAFFRGGIEATVKEAAVKNKGVWFGQ